MAARLPAGMRDWLPQQARRRARVTARVMKSLELFGYDRVGVPPFEYVEVVGSSPGGGDAQSLRFVEPESGELVALRSDVTPQIARLVASRMADGPWPARLSYQAAVMRRRQERARLDHQVFQVGFELVGRGGLHGDLETLEASVGALKASGITHFTVDLAHAGIASSLLREVPAPARSQLAEGLSVKDARRVHDLAHRSGLRGRNLAALAGLTTLCGRADLWPRAERLLSGTPAQAPFESLRELWRSTTEARLAPNVVVDLGETRAFFYYTGFMFHLLSDGPGEPLASGGRYDTLFDRFGAPRPAAGCAFDLNNLCWALDVRGDHDPSPTKLLVVASNGTPESTAELLRTLRRRGLACAAAPSEAAEGQSDPHGYGRAHGFSHVLAPSPLGGAHLSAIAAKAEPVRGGREASEVRAFYLEASGPVALAEVVSAQLGVPGAK